MSFSDVKCKYMSVIVTLLLAARVTKVSGWKYLHFEEKPSSSVIYTDVGKNVTMKWRFTVEENHPYKDEGWLLEFLFGEWNYPGYISLKMMLVKGSHIKMKNNYKDKIIWNGNITNPSNCSCQVTLVNLTSTDFKKYGINIFAHPYLLPLQHSLRIVRRRLARIISWLSVNVNEGNSTVVKCKADGAPLPFVEIHKKDKPNELLANGTEEADYYIPNVKLKHHGVYICTAHSDDKSRSLITKSMKLSVYKRAVYVDDGLSTTKPEIFQNQVRPPNKGTKTIEQPIKAAYIMIVYCVIRLYALNP